MVPWAHLSPQPKRIVISLAVFAGLTIVTDRQTDRLTDLATRSVTIGCIYVCNTAIRPINDMLLHDIVLLTYTEKLRCMPCCNST